MSRASTHRTRTAGLLVALSILGASLAESAVAAPIRIPRIKPPVTLTDLPRPRVAVPESFSSSSTWHTDDPAVVSALEDAQAIVKSDVDDTSRRVAADPQALAQIKQCAGDGLKAAGQSYAERANDAAATGEPAPVVDFHEIASGAAECMQTYFPDVPFDDLTDLGLEIAEHEAQSAQTAIAASQSAAVLAQWMIVSGDAIVRDAAVATDFGAGEVMPSDSGSDSDDESPPWALILGIAGIAGIVFIVYAARRSKHDH